MAIDVVVVPLGAGSTELNLGKVVRTANRVQRHFHLSVERAIEHLGEPGIDGEYRFDGLADLLKVGRDLSAGQVVVGVIDSILETNELFSGVDEANCCIVVSTTGNDLPTLLAQHNRTFESYILTEVAAQLLAIEYRRHTGLSCDPAECGSPWHRDPRACLFDYCDDPHHTLKKLINPRVCDACAGILTEAGLQPHVIEACQAMVREGWRSRLTSVMSRLFKSPGISFLFGGVFGGVVVSWVAEVAKFLGTLLLVKVLALIALVCVLVWIRWRAEPGRVA